jgi:putative dimethyl sulfoxide reductase chaperone
VERGVPRGEISVSKREEATVDALAALLVGRTFAYDILQCAFVQVPSVAFISLLLDDELFRAFPFAKTDAAIDQAVRRIEDYLGGPDALSSEAIDRLRWDYTRMFIGPGRVPAPPWESVYRNGEHLHFSDETLDVRDAYRKYQLATRELGREPDDHVGLELDFLHRLSAMETDAAEQGNEARLAELLEDHRTFLDEHVLAWVPEWIVDVLRSADTDFYRGMAQLLGAFVRLDRELTSALLETCVQTTPSSR